MKTAGYVLGLACSVLVGVVPAAVAQDCSAEKTRKLKKECLEILHDVEGTLDVARRLDGQGAEKGREAVEKYAVEGAKAAKTIADLFLKCRPMSAGCVNAVRKIPGHVQELRKARDLYREAEDLWRQAGSFYGAAEVAFSDQGGDEIADQLRNCDENSCWDLGREVAEFARGAKDRTARNETLARDAAEAVDTLIEGLENCAADPEECEKLNLPKAPDFENLESPPRIDLG